MLPDGWYRQVAILAHILVRAGDSESKREYIFTSVVAPIAVSFVYLPKVVAENSEHIGKFFLSLEIHLDGFRIIEIVKVFDDKVSTMLDRPCGETACTAYILYTNIFPRSFFDGFFEVTDCSFIVGKVFSFLFENLFLKLFRGIAFIIMEQDTPSIAVRLRWGGMR